MQTDLIPESLQPDYQQFLQLLEGLNSPTANPCPYCVSKAFRQTRAEPLTFRCKACFKYYNPLTKTPFNRLMPIEWLSIIFVSRIHRETYQTIADKLDCSVKKVVQRDKAMMRVMQQRFADFHQWYCTYNQAKQSEPSQLPNGISEQQVAFKKQLTERLTATKANCPYCDSVNTVKVSKRTAFRCKTCLRGFNLLDNLPIRRFRNAEHWLPFIDLLASKQNNLAISQQLGFNNSTVGHWRRVWCGTMQQLGFDALAIWCKR